MGEAKLLLAEELRDVPEYGDHMTLEEFIDNCKCGGFIDYDGHGRYATADKESDKYISPSDVMAGAIDKKWSHVVWYNK